MDKKPLIAFIESHSPTDNRVACSIADQFEERLFLKNEYFLRAGQVSNSYLFLAEGFMRAFTFDADGSEVTTYFHGQNKAVFEVSSLFLRIISTENIQALTNCRGYTISFDKLNALFHNTPEFREFGRAMLVKEFAAFKQRTLALINKSAEEHYTELITTNRELFQYAQLKHIASFLGITDTSLSRIRREFAKKS